VSSNLTVPTFSFTIEGERTVENKRPTWEMSYEEIWYDWSSRYSFGAKGELTPSEAREVHNKWKRLGIEARMGL
jgi:hypothetical protein